MKSKITKTAALLLSFTLIFVMNVTAFAHQVPDVDRKGSIEFTMFYGGDLVGGGNLALYKVGEVFEDDGNYSFVPGGDFAACGETFDNLDTENLAIAERLKDYARNNSIDPMVKKDIDDDGEVKFTDLPIGLYLVTQPKAAPGYYKIEPFLFSLPTKVYLDDGWMYRYDLSAEPKTELELAPTPTPTPTPTPPPNIPNTGQLWWPVPLLLCGGLLFVVIGFMLSTRKKSDEN